MEKEVDSLQLGGNIELNGFHRFRGDEMVIVKKMVGSYAKQFSEQCEHFEKLSLHLNSQDESYELEAQLINNGSSVSKSSSDNNFFFVLDRVLKDIECSLQDL